LIFKSLNVSSLSIAILYDPLFPIMLGLVLIRFDCLAPITLCTFTLEGNLEEEGAVGDGDEVSICSTPSLCQYGYW
jgi:hypothetical protein